MTSKHKNIEINKSLIIIGIIILFILVNLFGKDQMKIQSIFNKKNPSVLATPTEPIKILPAEGLNTDKELYVRLAIKVLTEKLKVKEKEIKTISAEEKNWSDSSLGCSEKGKIYIQAITPGYIIKLSFNGINYTYHGGLNRVVSCKSN